MTAFNQLILFINIQMAGGDDEKGEEKSLIFLPPFLSRLRFQ